MGFGPVPAGGFEVAEVPEQDAADQGLIGAGPEEPAAEYFIEQVGWGIRRGKRIGTETELRVCARRPSGARVHVHTKSS